jgi:ABC-2 type transport system ATP-binding protein
VLPEKKKARKDWVLEMAGIEEKRSVLTRSLATGFKQRLALGCAVLHEPSVLFLDEPTSGVDPLSRRNFWDLIREMAERGTTVFVTTHYMEEADYCDRLGLIYRGRIIAQGAPMELRQRYMKREILEIATDRTVEGLEVLLKNGIESAVFGSTLHATVDDAEGAAPNIRRVLEAQGVSVERMEKAAPTLEDVFVALIEAS